VRVKVRGETYKDVATAATALGVTEATIYCAVSRRDTETIGLGQGNRVNHRGGIPPKPITLGRITFPSMSAASRALGKSPRYVQQVLTKGKARARQNLIKEVMEYHLKQEKLLR